MMVDRMGKLVGAFLPRSFREKNTGEVLPRKQKIKAVLWKFSSEMAKKAGGHGSGIEGLLAYLQV